MKLFACWTEAVRTSFEGILEPSLSISGLDPHITRFDNNPCPLASFISPGWKEVVFQKFKWFRDVAHGEDDIFVYSDIDIQFFVPMVDALLSALGDNDIVFSEDGGYACSGFIVCRPNDRTLSLLDTVCTLEGSECVNDQDALNKVLSEGVDLKWELMSQTVCWNYLSHYGLWSSPISGFPVPANIMSHHANFVIDSASKVELARIVREEREAQAYS